MTTAVFSENSRGDSAARAAANYVSECMFHFHRGLLDCGDKIVIFGNDGYSDNAKSQEEVDFFRKILIERDHQRREFAVSDSGSSWAFVVYNYEQNVIDLEDLEECLWNCWHQACEREVATV